MAAIIPNHMSAARRKDELEGGMVLGSATEYHACMIDRDKFQDFKWWRRLAVVVGIIWFGGSLMFADLGMFLVGLARATVRSLAGSLAATGLVAAVGLFVCRLPTADGQDDGGA